MPLVTYDTQELINNVELICSVPLTQITYTELDLVIFANNILRLNIVPLIMKARQEYFVTSEDVTPPSNGIIPIPSNAIAGKVEYIMATNSNGGEITIPRLDRGVVSGQGAPYSRFNAGNNNIAGSGGFLLKGNNIHLYPNTLLNTYNQNVRVYYFARTLILAQPSAYGRITAIDLDNNTVEVDNAPSDWTTDTLLNIQQSLPNEFKNLVPSISVVSVNSTTVELDGSLEDVSVGDYLCDQGYAAIPQIPPDFFPYLYQLTAAKCMEGLEDTQAMQNAQAVAEAIKTDLIGLISDRVEGQPQKIINTNRFFGGGIRRRFGRY